jgi:hypothetical protein
MQYTLPVLCSFYILDVADLDAATGWAAAAYGAIEVRPMVVDR